MTPLRSSAFKMDYAAWISKCSIFVTLFCNLPCSIGQGTQPRLVTITPPPGVNPTQPSLVNLESIPGVCVQSGVSLAGVASANLCLQICLGFGAANCQAFDYDPSVFASCTIHPASTACGPTVTRPSCTHYRVRSQCSTVTLPPGCTPVSYARQAGLHRLGGGLVAVGVSLQACEGLCTAEPRCLSVDWQYDDNSFSCFLHTSPGVMEASTCCIHAEKQCPSAPPVGTPVMTLPTASSPPNIFPTQPIDDSGVCPSMLQLIQNEYQDNGAPVAGIASEAACKQYCLNSPLCVGVDYNVAQGAAGGQACFSHDTIIQGDIASGDCCNRYVKITCRQKMCYEHAAINAQQYFDLADIPSLDLELFNDIQNVRPSGAFNASAIACDGACKIIVTTNPATPAIEGASNPFLVERQCSLLESPADGKACRSTTNAQGYDVTTCLCYGDLCNAFGVDLLDSCAAYYPFDNSADDSTPFLRHGTPVGVTFDPLEKMKNVSAKFNGQSFIQVDQFSTYFFGSVSGVTRTPHFTVALWLRRTDMTGRQAVLNNGPQGFASLDLYTLEVDHTQMEVVGEVFMEGTRYTVRAMVPLDQWVFVVLRISAPPLIDPAVVNQVVYYVELFVDDVTSAADYQETTVRLDTTSVGIASTNTPLCIGKQYTAFVVGFSVVGSPDNHFIGFMDELFLFSAGLSQFQMETVKGTSSMTGMDSLFP